ncbi:MAG: glycosyltransferase family protein [Lachnospiraceae bacterium]|nr:glycosyltransferase family protein [Lachnospiraceae bacterium]
MNDKEFCFIICSNDKLYTKECLHYINYLIVPKGYQIDILTVEKAKSMTAGYNEAMQYSKAKYKVYLHQDTFIINQNFIQDCLDIFKNDKKIGMIGNIGAPKLPTSGIMWETVRCGKVYEQHIYETSLVSNPEDEKIKSDFFEVEAIDGFLMVTQYDICWREDFFDKWDFYDCSQSMEFIRRGYRVVVPQMKQPWCVHDCGFVNLQGYEEERKKFLKEYFEK